MFSIYLQKWCILCTIFIYYDKIQYQTYGILFINNIKVWQLVFKCVKFRWIFNLRQGSCDCAEGFFKLACQNGSHMLIGSYTKQQCPIMLLTKGYLILVDLGLWSYPSNGLIMDKGDRPEEAGVVTSLGYLLYWKDGPLRK